MRSAALVPILLTLVSCANDKYPALTLCKKLEKASFAEGCMSNNPPQPVAYAIDAAGFGVASMKSGERVGGIIVFKTAEDFESGRQFYTSPAGVLTGYKVQPVKSRKVIVLMPSGASGSDVTKVGELLE